MLGFPIKNSSWLGHMIMDVAMMETEIKRWQKDSNHNVECLYCFHTQSYRDYRQVCHSLTVYCAVIKIVRLPKCWFWRELSQKVTRISKYFPFDIWSIHWSPIRYIDRTLKTGTRYISHTGTRPQEIRLIMLYPLVKKLHYIYISKCIYI